MKRCAEALILAAYAFYLLHGFKPVPRQYYYAASFYYELRKDCPSALRYASVGMRESPWDTDFHYLAALCYYDMGNPAAAAAVVAKAIKMKPDDERFRRMLTILQTLRKKEKK